jgi:hypothetical protein
MISDKGISEKFQIEARLVRSAEPQNWRANLLNLAMKQPNLASLTAKIFMPSVSVPQYFLEIHMSLVDSYAMRCNPQLLFSRFDIPCWLQLYPKLIDVSNLI